MNGGHSWRYSLLFFSTMDYFLDPERLAKRPLEVGFFSLLSFVYSLKCFQDKNSKYSAFSQNFYQIFIAKSSDFHHSQ